MASNHELVERDLVARAPHRGLPGLFDGGRGVTWVEGEVEVDLVLGRFVLLLLQLVPLFFALGEVGLGVVDGSRDEGLDLVKVVASVQESGHERVQLLVDVIFF